MEHDLGPARLTHCRRVQLEYRAEIGAAALGGRAVERAGRIHEQTGERNTAVAAAREAIKHALPRWRGVGNILRRSRGGNTEQNRKRQSCLISRSSVHRALPKHLAVF